MTFHKLWQSLRGSETPQFHTMLVPVVDLSAIRSDRSEDRRLLAQQLHHACADVGFLQVVNHGVGVEPHSLLDFFDFCAPEEKEALSRGKPFREDKSRIGIYRGYFSADEKAPSFKEGFEIGPAELNDPTDELKRAPSSKGFRVLNEPNRWPATDDDLRAAWKLRMKDYYEEMRLLGVSIICLAAMALGLPEDYFEPFFDDGVSTLRLIR